MKLLFALVSLALTLSSTACDSPPPREKMLRVALPGQPANLDTNKAYDAIAGLMLMQMHEGLTRHSPTLEVEPGLAESWEFEDDFKTITFTLRDDARWSDGARITAHDFEYGWKRLLNPETAAEYAYFLFDIDGAEAFNAGEGTADAVGVDAIDDRTLRVKLRRPAPFFPHLTTFTVTHPVRQDVVERHGNAWTEPGNIVVSGAFVPVEYMHEYRMTLVPNPHWALGRPHIDRLELYLTAEKATALNLFIAGQMDIVLDLLPIAIPAFRGEPVYASGPKLEVRYVGIRVDAPPLDDVRVREALAKAIRREEIPDVLKGGEIATTSWLPPGMFGHAPHIGHAYAPDEARALLAEAGYPGGEGFPGFVLLFRAGDDWRLVAENLQQQWKRELGIDVEIQTREQKAFFREIDGEAPPPAHLARWIADFPDPENFMSLFKSNSGNNSLGFADTTYDELVEAAVRTAEESQRSRLYDDAQKILVEEHVAMIPIYVAGQNNLVHPRLEGVTFNAMGDARFGGVRWRAE